MRGDSPEETATLNGAHRAAALPRRWLFATFGLLRGRVSSSERAIDSVHVGTPLPLGHGRFMTRIDCVQFAPELGDLAANVAAITAALARILQRGSDIVVFPELATSGYMFTSPAEAAQAAVPATDPIFEIWRAMLAGLDTVLVVGFAEANDAGRTYNSAVLIDSTGVRSVYRKTHLWDNEKLVFEPGGRLPDVVETAHGRLVMLVCYDLEFPEMIRHVTLAGADVILSPVNWPAQVPLLEELPGEVITAMGLARVNGISIVVSDRAGTERGQEWEQASSIIDANGRLVAIRRDTGVLSAHLDLTESRTKSRSHLADLIGDRRTDLYS